MGKIRTLRTVAHAQRTIIALTLAAGIVGGASGQTTASMFGTLFSGVYCSIFTCEATAPVQPVTTQQWTGTTPQAQGQIREHPVWVNAPAPAAAPWQQVGGNAWNVPTLYGAPQQTLNPPFPELPRPGAVSQPQHAPVPPMRPPMQVRINQWNDPESLCALPWVDCPGRESTTGVNTQGGDSGAEWTGGSAESEQGGVLHNGGIGAPTGGSSTSPQGGNTVDGQTGGGWWNVDQVDDFSTEYEFINASSGTCTDGSDNDNDYLIDDDDPGCDDWPNLPMDDESKANPHPAARHVCENQMDDDDDSMVDDDDPGCDNWRNRPSAHEQDDMPTQETNYSPGPSYHDGVWSW